MPWFHGKTSREEAQGAIEKWEASHCEGRRQRGVFLFRFSDRQVQQHHLILILRLLVFGARGSAGLFPTPPGPTPAPAPAPLYSSPAPRIPLPSAVEW